MVQQRKRQTRAPAPLKLGEHDPEHLLHWGPVDKARVASGALGGVTPASLSEPMLNECVHLSRQILQRGGATGRSEHAELSNDWHPVADRGSRVVLLA